ncbi:cytochrome C assembly family protein [Paenibacillus hexagrammi]|uniref:Cytochrome c biogenesis protein n=1 Tax=Paenibacillus hexagrammi TaxID=2908839 RepID=A0ABY3SF22_9BACL|nr:cytochrome c biogenesis protein CcsA [Paenibacillus sp. YPD9-1]UJF32023.1 cytochrome c biogenesis protein [Paenibacillus sp. YPD9-1]
MVTRSLLLDAMIYIYALSLLFYFSDFASANKKAKRMGTGLLLFVWVLQTAYLAFSLYTHSSELAFSRSDILYFFTWLLITMSLIINRFIRIELFVFFINVFGFALLALNVFGNPQMMPVSSNWDVNSELLFIHITMAVGSYAAFTAAAIFSGMYIFLHRKLKVKQFSDTVMRLPSLEKMEQYSYRSVIIGGPLLLLALCLGIVWISLQGDGNLFYDPKVVNSVFVLAAYGFYLFQRLSMRISGNRLALWNIAAFIIVMLNFVVSNFFSGFHSWIWS